MITSRAISNLISGIGQRAAQVLAGFVAVPLYIHLLGDSQYGILSFFAAISGLIAVIDLGLPTLVTRQAALAKHGDPNLAALSMHAELASWGLGLIFGAIICLGSGVLAPLWPSGKPEAAPPLVPAIMLLSIQFAMRWPIAFYQAAFIGIERHTLPNSISILAIIIQHGGGIAILLLQAPSLINLVIWQGMVAFFQALALALIWHRQVTWPCRPLSLRGMCVHARFCCGTVIAAILAMAVQQTDKILVGRATDLETFAHYAVAGTIASMAGVLMGPLASIYLPRLSRSQHEDPFHAAADLRRFTWFFNVLALPGSSIMIFFAPALCGSIFHDPATADTIADLLPGLTVGTMLGQYAIILYQAELAVGATGPTAWVNLWLCVLGSPLCYALVHIGGIPGAIIYLLLTSFANLIAHLVYCRRVFPVFTPLRWLTIDILPPLAVSAATMTLGRFLSYQLGDVASQLVTAIASALIAASLIGVISPQRFLWQELHLLTASGFRWIFHKNIR